MRYRLMATYRGVPYEAGVGPSGSDVVLFAACPPPEELGFEPATGHWRKRVIRAEVDALWESRPVGTFRDEPCIVLDDLGDRLHIAYLGEDAGRAASVGYWQVDRGVFELLAPREEVTGLIEQRVEKPLWLSPPAAPAAPGPSYPYDSVLADLAAIPREAYALETETEGAMCLMRGADGFEVFVAMDGARHEARLFPDEEAAYFYLFGVLAAEAVRNRALLPAVSAAGTRPGR